MLIRKPMAWPVPAAGAPTQRVGGMAQLPTLIRELGGDPGPLLAKAGLDPRALDHPGARVSLASLGDVLQLGAEATGCGHLGLTAGRLWHLRDLGLVGELARNAPTVRAAVYTLVVHQHLNSDSALTFALERGDTVDLGYAIYDPQVRHAAPLYDCVLAVIQNLMRELCGPRFLPGGVLVPHAEPLNARPYRAFFRVRPRFDAEYCALRFPASWMDAPVEGADPRRWEEAHREVNHYDEGPLLQQVVRALRTIMLHGKASGDDVANILSMHRRTLNRRLKASGTTFQAILDQVRGDVARQMLAESDISLDEIAAALGYAGVSPFMRSFRRWTGTTPGSWRRRSRESGWSIAA